jgi:photosystem II stability/assembly factor-like uncharacterized protein
VLVGTGEQSLFVSDDGGARWRAAELPEPHVFSVAFDGDSAYAGTEPSHLFMAREGQAWSELQALQDIPSREHWSFPPRPWTHHVRWIAPDPHRSQRLLVGIELGGLMYSDDGGESFEDHRPGAKRDTHALAWHPRVEGRAYQAAGDGAAFSTDGGQTWQVADAGRDLRYCWALAVDPDDPDRWYVSAASGPRAAHSAEQARGRLYGWEGEAWSVLGVPADSMVYALLALDGGELVAGLADGRILHSSDRGSTWSETGVRTGSILALA